jgi:phage I-like protein
MMEKADFISEIPDCCKSGNNMVSEIQMIPFGTHETDRGSFTLDAEGILEVVGEFDLRANDMVIDYEHQSLGEGEAPAAGWIKRLINRGADGVWASVQWTPRAAKYLRNREYRYLSPVFMKRTSDGRVVRLLSAALTNTPAIDGMVPVVNRARPGANTDQGGHAGGTESPLRLRKEGSRMTKVLSALGLTAGATEEEALKAIEAMKAGSKRAASGEVLRELGLGAEATVSEAVGAVLAMKRAQDSLEEMDGLKSQVSDLKSRIAEGEAQGLVAQAMSEGKITPAQREWAQAYASRDPEGFRVFVSRSPRVVPRGEVSTSEPQMPTGAGGALQVSVNRLLMVSDEAFNKFSNKEE